jgi:hypothetical protein
MLGNHEKGHKIHEILTMRNLISGEKREEDESQIPAFFDRERSSVDVPLNPLIKQDPSAV